MNTWVQFISANIKWIMLSAGLLTCSMIFAVFAPETVLISMFGEALTQPLAQVIVRSWGFLIFLVGALLVYGAFKPECRQLALVISSVSKAAFISLIVIYGPQYIDKSVFTIILDSIFIIVFVAYLAKANSVN
jgi:hypothetical protein